MPDEEPEPEDAGPDIPEICVDIDPDQLWATLDMEVTTRLLSADVFFLVDCSASMRDEIANIRRGLTRTIVPGAMELIPDVQFGVAAFSDFPVADFGDHGDRAFELRRAITDDIGAVQSAIDGLPSWVGGDDPEAQTEALYEVATGDGLGDFIAPAPGCPRGGLGYPCFREGSQPVVMLITDAPFHNGPEDQFPYFGMAPLPRSFDQATSALSNLGVRVVGIDSGQARGHLEEVARATGAVDGSGAPLVYTISSNGQGINEEMVRGLETLALRVPVDVDAIVVDVGGDDLDATILVQRVIAVRAEPEDGVQRIAGDTFHQVMPGTQLFFDLEIRVDVIPTPPTTTLYPVLVRFRTNRVSVIHEQIVYIEVPGLDGANACGEQ